LVREAGRVLGEVLATVFCVVNPGVLVIAGDLAETKFLTGVREVLYRLALPRAGVVGAHPMVVESGYPPDAVDRRPREVGS
jgi:hypothetical protein